MNIIDYLKKVGRLVLVGRLLIPATRTGKIEWCPCRWTETGITGYRACVRTEMGLFLIDITAVERHDENLGGYTSYELTTYRVGPTSVLIGFLGVEKIYFRGDVPDGPEALYYAAEEYWADLNKRHGRKDEK